MTWLVVSNHPDWDGDGFQTYLEALDKACELASEGGDVSVMEWVDWQRSLTPDQLSLIAASRSRAAESS